MVKLSRAQSQQATELVLVVTTISSLRGWPHCLSVCLLYGWPQQIQQKGSNYLVRMVKLYTIIDRDNDGNQFVCAGIVRTAVIFVGIIESLLVLLSN